MIKQLVYISYTTENFNFEKDINDILDKARKKNPELDLTGMLVYRDEMFIQLLEGPVDNVNMLYGTIGMDKRHSNVSVIVNQESEERLFPDWTMGFRDAGNFNLAMINDVLSIKDVQEKSQRGEQIPSDKILELLKKFRYWKEDDQKSA